MYILFHSCSRCVGKEIGFDAALVRVDPGKCDQGGILGFECSASLPGNFRQEEARCHGLRLKKDVVTEKEEEM